MAENQTVQQPVRGAADENENALSTRIAQKADSLKYVILVAAALVVAVVAVVLYVGGARAKQQAADADSVFRSFAALQGKTPAEAAPELAETARRFAGQPAGIQAAVHAFGAAMDAAQYAEAETVGNEFIKNYPESPLVPRFRLALAQAQIQQGKTREAIDGLRVFTATATPETLPEAKLALAQALERFAEEAKDNPEEYAVRLQAAEAEYTDITARARDDSPARSGFWPQLVTLTADYALVQIKDRLAGHVLPEPVAAAGAAVTPEELETVRSLRPPGAAEEETDAGAEEEEEPEN